MDFETEIDRVVPDNFPTDDDKKPIAKPGPHNVRNNEPPVEEKTKPGPEPRSTQHTTDENHILIIGADELNNRFFLQSLITDKLEELTIRALKSPIYTGRVLLRGGAHLKLMALKPDEQYLMLLDYFYEKTFACLFLIDLDAGNWNYQRYLFKAISEHLQVPTMIVGKYRRMSSDFESQIVRDRLDIGEDLTLRFISDFEADTCRRVLFTLINEVQGSSQSIQLDSERLATK